MLSELQIVLADKTNSTGPRKAFRNTAQADYLIVENCKGRIAMIPMVLSIWAIGLLTAAMVLAAATSMHATHILLCAVMAIVLAFLASRENNEAIGAGENASAIASINARYMGMVWAWGALAIAVTYGLVLDWKEWWQFLMACIVLSGLCLFFSAILRNDATDRGEDETMLTLARYLTIAQFVGMLIAMAGLLIDGKMVRFLNARHTDWAANNIFFFGAFALAVISFVALRAHAKASAPSET